MMHSIRFWISMLVFQILFGLTVFAITRDYYTDGRDESRTGPVTEDHPSLEPPGQFSSIDPNILDSLALTTSDDPVEISRLANQRFANRQYVAAADLYERLLSFDPNSVDTLNNLGLTLHYIGRSDEALQRLNEGIAVDPSYQRIWLTLGYVNSELGNIEQARAALAAAMELDPDTDVGRSAAGMLADL